MRMGRFGSSAVILLILAIVSQSIYAAFGQNQPENNTTTAANSSSLVAEQLADAAGIWNASFAGISITMALNQSGDSIFGWCKFEGAHTWNGVIAGSLSGNAVNIAIAAVQGKVLQSTDIMGKISNDALQGHSVSYDSNGNEASGNVTGTRISPDVSDYTPVEVEAVAETAKASTPAVEQQAQPIPPAQSNETQNNKAVNSRFKDVTQMARGINANILPWSFHL